MTSDIASVSLPDGERIPKLGQGTWEMGEIPARRAAEIDALRCGVELDHDAEEISSMTLSACS